MKKLIALAPLVAGFLVAIPIANSANVSDSEQVSNLLSDAKTLAFQLKEDAVIMESYTLMNVSWENHAAAINQVREHVALRRNLTRGPG
jgi:hypothetical protein